MKHISEKGQSIVIVALSMFFLIAVLALVIDGGYTYWMRRNAQNAADAGAVAGATVLCETRSTGLAESTALDFAINRNGASTATAQATLFDPGGTVEVQANINFQSIFSQIFGMSTIDAPASAKAGCAPPEGVGVMPVAWSCKAALGDPSVPPEECDIYYMDDERLGLTEDDLCEWGVDPMYIIADSDDVEDEIICDDPDEPPQGYVDCDLDNDGTNDIELLSGGDRSWLDLNAGGGGASELKDWISGDYEDLTVTIHDWAPAQTGVTGSVYQTVHEEILLEDVVVPVFNAVHADGPPPEDWPHPEDDVIGNEPHDYFHISSFSYWRTTCVDSGPYPKGGDPPCPAREALNLILQGNPNWTNGEINSLNSMEGCFLKGTVGGIGGNPGQGIDAGVYVVFLME